MAENNDKDLILQVYLWRPGHGLLANFASVRDNVVVSVGLAGPTASCEGTVSSEFQCPNGLGIKWLGCSGVVAQTMARMRHSATPSSQLHSPCPQRGIRPW